MFTVYLHSGIRIYLYWFFFLPDLNNLRFFYPVSGWLSESIWAVSCCKRQFNAFGATDLHCFSFAETTGRWRSLRNADIAVCLWIGELHYHLRNSISDWSKHTHLHRESWVCKAEVCPVAGESPSFLPTANARWEHAANQDCKFE